MKIHFRTWGILGGILGSIIFISGLFGCKQPYQTSSNEILRKDSLTQHTSQKEKLANLTPSMQQHDTLLWNKSLNKLSLLQTTTAKVTITFKNPQMNHTLNGHLTVKKNNLLFLSLTAFLGIKVFDAYFAKDSMWVHNIFEGRLFMGETTPENINKMVKITLPFPFFTTIALGVPTWNTAPNKATKTQNGYQYTWQSNHSEIAFTISDSLENVTNITIEDSTKQSNLSITCSNFQTYIISNTQGTPITLHLPNKIEMKSNIKTIESLLSFTFHARQTNEPHFNFLQSPPPNIKPIFLEEIEFKQ